MNDINKMIAAYAQDAVECGKKFRKELDFSEQSIQRVEEICVHLYNDIPRDFLGKLFRKSPSEEEIIKMSYMLGAYVGEVMKQHLGGNWTVETFQNKSNTLVLNIGEVKTFPVAKVYKRLKNGPEDNLYHYYHFISKEISKG